MAETEDEKKAREAKEAEAARAAANPPAPPPGNPPAPPPAKPPEGANVSGAFMDDVYDYFQTVNYTPKSKRAVGASGLPETKKHDSSKCLFGFACPYPEEHN